MLSDRRKRGPHGLAGGVAGIPGKSVLIRSRKKRVAGEVLVFCGCESGFEDRNAGRRGMGIAHNAKDGGR